MVNLTHEQDLLDEIDNLNSQNQIQNSVGLPPQEVKSKIERLIKTTQQRINATELHLNLIKKIDSEIS